jgi:WD40 repeat protein
MTGEGRKLVTSSHFGSARLWDLEKGWGQRLKRRSGRVDLLAITPDGSYAISEDSRAIKV